MSTFNFFGGINGNNIIINGKKIDETKKNSSVGVSKIRVISNNVRVNIIENHESKIVARLHGSASSLDFRFSLSKIAANEIQITAEFESMSSGVNIINGVVISGSFSNLELDVCIPHTTLEILDVQTDNSSISIDGSNATMITASSKNGSIQLKNVTFETLSLECKNGSIKIESYVKSEVKLNVSTKNGSIDCMLGNIGASTVKVSSKNGSCTNAPNLSGEYTATGFISSKNGSVKFY